MVVRTRIAPSPTGKLHIGTARVALFNYLFAKKEKGSFILRIEDTDRARSKKEYENDIIESLTWLGLIWDEFYRSSERMPIYRKYLEKLLEEKKAFYCPCPPSSELSAHFCPQKDAGNSEGIIRFKLSDNDTIGSIRFLDLVRREVVFQGTQIGDFSLAKSLDEPLYNFAVVMDDYEMNISHVIRGEDHISNTPKQILLQEALGFPRPIYAHLPLVLGEDRSKLSKRHGAVSIAEYRDSGYLSEAIVNFIAFLGWNPGDKREFFTLQELIEEFSLARIKKGGAIFNIARLNFINKHYIKKLSSDEFTKRALPFLEKDFGTNLKNYDFKKLQNILELEKERIDKLSELPKNIDFFFNKIPYPTELLMWKDTPSQSIRENLDFLIQIIEKIPKESYNGNSIKDLLVEEVIRRGGDKGSFFWPLRVALSGKENSPGPFDIAAQLGKDETLVRIFYAIRKLNESAKNHIFQH